MKKTALSEVIFFTRQQIGILFLFICLGVQTSACGNSGNSPQGDTEDTAESDSDSPMDSDTPLDTDTLTGENVSTESSSAGMDSDSESDPHSTMANCDALVPPSGNIIAVTPEDTPSLRSIVAGAQPGDSIVFADGTYHLNGDYLWISTPDVTLRSQSGNPDTVVIDGGYQTTEIITVAASNVTIAELTITRATTHPIHVTTSETADTVDTLIYRVHIIDPGEQAIKINNAATGGVFADDGTVACSTIELTDAGRPHVNMTATPCYTGGIDAHEARGWTIRDNVISGFWCSNGLAEHAVHFWRGGRDTLVERNILANNARGVGFGMADSGDARVYADSPCSIDNSLYVGHYGGIIRNNFIFANEPGLLASGDGFDCGVCLWSACEAQVLHNTIVSTGNLFSSIEWRFASGSATVMNNLVTHPLRERDGATATQAGNLEDTSLANFVDVATGDLHLLSDAAAKDAGQMVTSGLCPADIDGDVRDATPDVGADEI